MAIHKKGGLKKAFRTKKEYQAHLRTMVRDGKGNTADGDWTSSGGDSMGRRHMVAGYHFNR